MCALDWSLQTNDCFHTQFEAKVSARKFRAYQCTGVNLARANLEKIVSNDGDASDTEKG